MLETLAQAIKKQAHAQTKAAEKAERKAAKYG
jgi:hypothetical protein